jgi:hypothetical protein
MSGGSEWLTPAEAENLVAHGQGGWSLLLRQARHAICGWLADGHVSAKALEVVRWKDAPRQQSDQESASRLPAGVQPLGSPIMTGDLPLHREVGGEEVLTIQHWQDVGVYNPDVETLFASAEITLPLRSERHPHARVTYSGVRFLRSDIERRMEISGWTVECPTELEKVGRPDKFTLEGARSLGLSGQYLGSDFALILEMHPLIQSGQSVRAAADLMASRADGPNTERGSRADRLRRLYSQWDKLGA